MKTISFKSGVLLFCFLVTISAGCSDKKRDAKEYIESARVFLSRNMPETAVIEFRNAIQSDENNATAYFELAETYVLLGRLTPAVINYELAIKVDPGHIPALLRIAQIHMTTNQLLDAREYISKVLERDPASVKALHILSGIQIKERDVDAAIETLNKAASIDDRDIRTFISLARLYRNTRSHDRAEKAYLKAVAIDPSSRKAYMGLVRFYAGLKKWDQIEELFKKIIRTDGKKTEKYTDFARFYEGRNNAVQAEFYYQKAVSEAGEGMSAPLMNLAEFYTKQDMRDKAVVTMENAAARQKDNPLVLSGLSQIYLHFDMIESAETAIDAALKIDNSHVDALTQKGRVLMAQKDYKKALDIFDRVIAADRTHATAYYYRAICIEERGATDRPEQKIFRAAVGMLDKPEEFEKDQIKNNLLAAITVDPTHVDARVKLTEIYLLEKNLKKAKEQVQEILKLRSPDIRTMTLISGVNILEGNIKGAEEILQVIIEERPDYIPAQIRLGLLYKSANQPEKAIKYLKAAYEKDTNRVRLVEFMAETLLSQGEFDQALSLCRKLQSDAAPEYKAFFENQIGEIYLAREDDTAAKHFTNAIALNDKYIKPRMHLAGLFHKGGLPEKALAEYRRIEQINPEFVPALIRMAAIFDTGNNLPEARKYYEKVLKIVPAHPNAANNLAFIYAEDPGRLDKAFRLAKIAREKLPKDPNVMDTMGWVYYKKGNYSNAISEFQESLKLQPENALTMYHYGMALYRTQQYEDAREYLSKALDLDPSFRGASEARKILN